MKKEERLHRLFGDIDDDLVADAAAKPIPLKVWLPRVTAAVAAVALTVGVVLAKPWASDKPPVTNSHSDTANDGNSTTTASQNGIGGNVPVAGGATLEHSPALKDPDHVAPPLPTGGTPTTSAEWTPDIWYELKWDEKPVWMKFPHFERFEIGSYAVRETATLTADKVGGYLEDVNLHGYDIYTETGYDIVGKIYRIKGINPHCAVALQYPDENEYFVAVCGKYSPATLGDLINDLSLRENLQVGTVYRSYRDENGRIHDFRYDGLTAEKTWELLLNDTTLPTVTEWHTEGTSKVSVAINVPLLGYHNISISLFADGYMLTYLLDTEKVFFIGADKVDAFLTYVEENCRVSHDQQVALPGDTNAVSGTTRTSPAQPPLVTGTTVWHKSSD